MKYGEFIMFKKIFLFILFAAVSFMNAEEIDLMNTAQWSTHYPKGSIEKKGNIVTFKNGASFTYKTMFEVDPAKKYTITFDARVSGKKAHTSVMYIPHTANNRYINTNNIFGSLTGITTVVENAAKGSTVIKLKDTSNFVKGLLKNCQLALNAKEDFSDLPNFNIVPVSIIKVQKEKDHEVLTLAKPLSKDIAAGTVVRQHYYGSAFYFNDGMRVQFKNNDWQSFEARCGGVAEQRSPVKFVRGTAKFRLALSFSGEKGMTVELRNLKMTVTPR